MTMVKKISKLADVKNIIICLLNFFRSKSIKHLLVLIIMITETMPITNGVRPNKINFNQIHISLKNN